MVVNSIKVFARIKKEKELNEQSYDIVRNTQKYEDIVFYKGVLVDSTTKFRFYEIFDQNTAQDVVFEKIAKPVVSSVLQGFNGTIFAYGQTGSGKTYTMTGSTKKYQDRGIIPRSLQFIFAAIEKIAEKPILYISYMEIYNEICYDLINPKDSKTASRLEELPRVTVFEDKKGEPRLRNLSVIPVSTEEEAMRLLFLGDTNRAIAETPLNEYSSRSHCIFTIYITSRPSDTSILRYSKLNLVDLAGSERVYKSNITGSTLIEAKHINLSLHFLQQVILALSESKRLHIPYRNSLMTFILKDSLAGNCLTVMLAALAVSRQNILETLSTCRFAQRVSLIKTEPIINEVSDPYHEILLLKKEIQELRKQLANRNSSGLKLDNHPLTNQQREDCEKKLENYLNGQEETFKIELDAKILQFCFSIFKNKIQKLESQPLEVEHRELNTSRACNLKNLQNKRLITKVESLNNFSSPEQDNILLQEFMSNPRNIEEISYYTKILSYTYEKAKTLALIIDECQTSITDIREKLVLTECSKPKQLLGRELECQQNLYRKSLVELKELKQETMQLEAGLNNAKGRMLKKFNEWATSTEHSSKMIDKKKRHHKVQFEDELNIIKSDNRSGNNSSTKSLELGLDFEGNEDTLCHCKTCDQLDSLTYRKHSQQQHYLYDISELPEDNLQRNGHIQRHYLTSASSSCCALDIQETQKPQRKKSCYSFSSQTTIMDGEVNNPVSECSCNKVRCSGDNNKVTKKVIRQCTGHACYKEDSHKNSKCNKNRYYEEVSDSGNILTSSKYVCNKNAKQFSDLWTQPAVQCCYNEQYAPVCHNLKSHNCYGDTNPPINTISTADQNLEDSVIPYYNKDGYTILCTNNVSPDLKQNNINKRNVNSGLSVESSVYLDTQLVPNKLIKEGAAAAKESVNKARSKETKAVIDRRSPYCQEISSTMDKSVGKTTPNLCVSPDRQEILSNSTVKLPLASTSITKAKMDISSNPKRTLTNDVTILEKSNNTNIVEKNKTKITNKSDGKYMAQISIPYKKYDIFLDSDTEDFRRFMKDISLTGDEEMDKEICDFYRSKFGP